MSLAAIAVKKQPVTYFFVFLLITAGIASYGTLGQLEDPEFTVKTAAIITPYPGASAEQVKNALQILLGDQNVKAVLINIFGGIMRCDIVATGVVQAARAIGIDIPVVVRLEGTNVEKGREILNESGLKFTVADGMKDAAEKVVALSK